MVGHPDLTYFLHQALSATSAVNHRQHGNPISSQAGQQLLISWAGGGKGHQQWETLRKLSKAAYLTTSSGYKWLIS